MHSDLALIIFIFVIAIILPFSIFIDVASNKNNKNKKKERHKNTIHEEFVQNEKQQDYIECKHCGMKNKKGSTRCGFCNTKLKKQG